MIVAVASCASNNVASSNDRDHSASKSSAMTFNWGASQGLWGTERLTIDRAGNAHYTFQSVRGQPPIDSHRQLAAADLAALRAATSEPGFCRLHSSRFGIPDEAQPSLTVTRGGHACVVTLWDGEWNDMPLAHRAFDAINQIIRRMK